VCRQHLEGELLALGRFITTAKLSELLVEISNLALRCACC